MPEVKLYDNLAGSYDMLISWKRRLQREKPFFRNVFREFGVKRILDTACGTGMHSIAFHDWGYFVVGTDISENMLDQARKNAGNRQIKFIKASFTELDKTDGMFDAVTCLGNSLPHVLSDEELERSLSSMFKALLPGGILIIHNNNYDRVLGKHERFMPLAQGKKAGKEYLFIRFFDFNESNLTFNVISLIKDSGKWQVKCDLSTHRPLVKDLLVDKLKSAGFDNIRVYGAFPDLPFEPLESDNLILVAQKPHNLVSCPRPEPVAAINRIPIRENEEPLVELQKAAPDIEICDKPVIVRKTVADMLVKAQSLLPVGYRLKVKTAYRSLERQWELYRELCERFALEHPDWPKSRLRREINKYLAPPDAKHPPGHSTGGAVDVFLIGPGGVDVDMGTNIPPTPEQMKALPTYSREISPRIARNRQILIDAMGAAGFSNYPGEWWHWSYGDSAWAVRVGESCAPYGAAPG